MLSRASLAADGMNSVKPTSVDPNLRFKCLARWDPRAFAASSGTVNKCTPSRVRNRLNQDSRTLGCLSPGRSESCRQPTFRNDWPVVCLGHPTGNGLEARRTSASMLGRYEPCHRNETYPLVFARMWGHHRVQLTVNAVDLVAAVSHPLRH